MRIIDLLPGPLTIDADDRVTGLIHPAEFVSRYEDPETGEVVERCVRLPTRADVFMADGVGHIACGTHPPLNTPADDVIRYYRGLAQEAAVVIVDELFFDSDGAHIVGHLNNPTARESVMYGRPSCDWRQVDHALTLVGAILVYAPGYPIEPVAVP